jgi:hypothetical protein
MKKKIMLSVGIIILLAVVIIGSFFVREYHTFRKYADNMLNRSVYGTCDNIIEMNAMLEKIVHQGYVLETELLILNEMYTAYISSFYDYEYITEQLKGFQFNVAHENQEYSFENMDFYNRCRDLFDEKLYKISDVKYELNDQQLEAFRTSLQYTQNVVDIIKQNINYYNTYEVVFSEEESPEGIMIHADYQFKEEYRKPWKDNRTGSSATVFIDGSIQPVEVPPYDYPKKPKLTARDASWFQIMKELKKLNIKE